jgi:hypothetical protein
MRRLPPLRLFAKVTGKQFNQAALHFRDSYLKHAYGYRTSTFVDWPQTELEEINGDLLEADFWPRIISA